MEDFKKAFKYLEEEDYTAFDIFYREDANLTDEERQNLLVKIMDELYTTERFFHLKNIFDLIIHPKLELNFDIDHHAPTFLSLVILRAPFKGIFDFFVKKGADINYVGDSFAFYSQDDVNHEKGFGIQRYQTCLDFAYSVRVDMFTCDYNFVPAKESTFNKWVDSSIEEVCLKTEDYVLLLEQSVYLNKLVSLDNLIDYIVDSGGKTFDELMEKKGSLLKSKI